MYRSESPQVVVPWTHRRFWTRAWRSVGPNVWYLGITSLLTDVSSEMVASVLPVHFVLHLNLSPFAFGALDGLYNGVTAATRWPSGLIADRWRRHKEVAAAGYAISALCKLGLLGAGRAWAALAVVIASGRPGRVVTVCRQRVSCTRNRSERGKTIIRAPDTGGITDCWGCGSCP